MSRKPICKKSEKAMKTEKEIFDAWENGTMAFAYSHDTNPALACLLKDLPKHDFWFNSTDLDKFMKKFIKWVLEDSK